MYSGHLSKGQRGAYQPSSVASGVSAQNDGLKSGMIPQTHDTTNASVPDICKRCNIPKYDGYKHRDLADCFYALKDYVKVCQDEIERTRLEGISHSRDLLTNPQVNGALTERLSIIADITSEIRQIVRGGTLAHAIYNATDTDSGREPTGYEEGSDLAQRHYRLTSYGMAPSVVRRVLSLNVPDQTQGPLQDQAQPEGGEDSVSRESSFTDRVRPRFPAEKRVPNHWEVQER
jgi:hypothetical protein